MSNEDKIGILRTGQKTDFWKIIVEDLNGRIADFERDRSGLGELPPDQYKVESEILIAKKKYCEALKELPKMIIDNLGSPDNTEENPDPYE